MTPAKGNGWETFEVALPVQAGWRYPVSDVLMAGGDPVHVAIADMVLLEELGFPPKPAGRLQFNRADNRKPPIYRLRCKPSCWRLYFFVDYEARRIIYLHCVCKKTNAQDPQDSVSARKRLNRCFAEPATARIIRFAFPDH